MEFPKAIGELEGTITRVWVKELELYKQVFTGCPEVIETA